MYCGAGAAGAASSCWTGGGGKYFWFCEKEENNMIIIDIHKIIKNLQDECRATPYLHQFGQ